MYIERIREGYFCLYKFSRINENWQFGEDLFVFLTSLPLRGILHVILKLYIISRIFEKRANMYSVKNSTFTVFHNTGLPARLDQNIGLKIGGILGKYRADIGPDI